MFTQSCFIRKNTPEIINRLKELGIPRNDYDDGDRPWIAVNYGIWISVDEGYNKLFPDEIDCGTNEELFFALAALRDDCNYMQWFICDDNESMFKVDKPNMTMEEFVHNYMDGWDTTGARKATVKEIIEHFK